MIRIETSDRTRRGPLPRAFAARAALASALLGILLTAAVGVADEPRLTIDRVIAQVNDRMITLSEVRVVSSPMEMELRARYAGRELQDRLADLYDDAISQLVERALIVWDFERQELSIPEKIVDDEIRRIIEEEYDGDRNAFRDNMRDQGFTSEEVRQEIRDRVIVQYMRRERIRNEIFISPRKIEDYYREHPDEFRDPEGARVRMLQLPVESPKPVISGGDGTGDGGREGAGEHEGDGGDAGADPVPAAPVPAEIADVVRRLESGEAFIDVAADAAAGSTAMRVRDWGWIAPGDLRPELDRLAFSLEAGEWADPVLLDSTWFLVYVEDRRETRRRDIDEIRNAIEDRLQIEERTRLHREWINSLRSKAFIRIYDH